MARTIKFNNASVYISPQYTGQNYDSGDIKQLHRVQSAEIDFIVSKNAQPALGTFSEDNTLLESPFVDLTVSYYNTNGYNESCLGFYVDGVHNSVKPIYNNDRDVFLLCNPDNPQHQKITMSFGNMSLESYSINGTVGGLLKTDVKWRGFNANAVEESSGVCARVDARGELIGNTFYLPNYVAGFDQKQTGVVADVSAISQGQITVDFNDLEAFGIALTGSTSSYLQSFNISLDLTKTEAFKIGQKYPEHRATKYPVRVQLSTEFIVSQREAHELRRLMCNSKKEIGITVYSNCNYTGDSWERAREPILKFNLKNLLYRDQKERVAIDGRKRVTVNWYSSITSNEIDHDNFTISGKFGQFSFVPDSFHEEVYSDHMELSGFSGINEQVVLKKYYNDIDIPDFDLVFKDDLDISDIHNFAPVIYFTGLTLQAIEQQGLFGADFNDPISGSNGLNELRKTYTGIEFSKVYGWLDESGNEVVEEGNYLSDLFYIKNLSCFPQNISLSICDLSNLSGQLNEYEITLSPDKPFYFNSYNIVGNLTAQESDSSQLCIRAKSRYFVKNFLLQGFCKDDFNIRLGSGYFNYFNFYLDTYQYNVSLQSGYSNGFIDGDSVETILTWKDLSLKHNDVFQTGDSITYEPNSLNGFGILHNSGLGYFVHNLNSYGSGAIDENFSNFDIFLVCKVGDTSSIDKIFQIAAHSNGSEGISYLVSGSHCVLRIHDTSNHDVIVSGAADDSWHAHHLRYDGSAFYAYVDNVLITSGALSITIPSSFTSENTVFMKQESSGNIYLAQFIASPFVLSESLAGNIKQYLNYKWGL